MTTPRKRVRDALAQAQAELSEAREQRYEALKQLAEAQDCGRAGQCSRSPLCIRHWIEEHSKRVGEREEARFALSKAEEREAVRWQDRLHALEGVREQDASGNESGDPLDYTADCVKKALDALREDLADARNELAGTESMAELLREARDSARAALLRLVEQYESEHDPADGVWERPEWVAANLPGSDGPVVTPGEAEARARVAELEKPIAEIATAIDAGAGQTASALPALVRTQVNQARWLAERVAELEGALRRAVIIASQAPTWDPADAASGARLKAALAALETDLRALLAPIPPRTAVDDGPLVLHLPVKGLESFDPRRTAEIGGEDVESPRTDDATPPADALLRVAQGFLRTWDEKNGDQNTLAPAIPEAVAALRQVVEHAADVGTDVRTCDTCRHHRPNAARKCAAGCGWAPLDVGADWPATNRRRGDLIERQEAGTITPAEAAELARLQRVADEKLAELAPWKPDAVDATVARLRAEGRWPADVGAAPPASTGTAPDEPVAETPLEEIGAAAGRRLAQQIRDERAARLADMAEEEARKLREAGRKTCSTCAGAGGRPAGEHGREWKECDACGGSGFVAPGEVKP